jgi:hypothetical protein
MVAQAVHDLGKKADPRIHFGTAQPSPDLVREKDSMQIVPRTFLSAVVSLTTAFLVMVCSGSNDAELAKVKAELAEVKAATKANHEAKQEARLETKQYDDPDRPFVGEWAATSDLVNEVFYIKADGGLELHSALALGGDSGTWKSRGSSGSSVILDVEYFVTDSKGVRSETPTRERFEITLIDHDRIDLKRFEKDGKGSWGPYHCSRKK